MSKVYDGSSLPNVKSDVNPAPGGLADSYWAAADFNNIRTWLQDIRNAVIAGDYHALLNNSSLTPVANSGIVRRAMEGRDQVSENGAIFKSVLRGADTYDIRDFATGMFLNNATQDTAGLVAAAAQCSSASDSTSNKPCQILFPRGTLLLNTGLTIYGGNSTGMSWIGQQGRSRGPDGTVIQWAGADNPSGAMLHLLGLNGGLFQDICLSGNNGTNYARFGFWCQSNQPNSGAGSSDLKFRDCGTSGFGHLGAGWLVGDEIRTTLTLTGVSGTFQVGEFVLDNTHDGVGQVISWNSGTGQLYLGMVLGTSFTTPSTMVTGLTSGATGTTTSVTVDPSFMGTYQCSETVWEHPLLNGTELTTTSHGTWAGIAFMGTGNNKNYTVINPRVDGVRYGFDGAGSGFLKIDGVSVGNIGHGGLGALCRANGVSLDWGACDFENAGSSFKARLFDLSQGCTATIHASEYFGLIPPDGLAIVNAGLLVMEGVKLGADTGTASIQNTGTLILDGCGWRENISQLPIVDGSSNDIAGNGSADYARNLQDNPTYARGCWANINSNKTRLPDMLGGPLLPLWNQLQLNNSANCGIVSLGRVSCSDPVFSISAAQVKSGAGAATLGQTPSKCIIRGVILDVSATFGGGSLSGVTASVGIDSNHTLYMAATDVHGGTGQFTNGSSNGLLDKPIVGPWAGDYLKVFFAFTGDVVANLSTGAMNVYILFERL